MEALTAGIDLRQLSTLALVEEESVSGYQAAAVVRRDLLVVRIHGRAKAGAGTARVTDFIHEQIARGDGVHVFYDLLGFHRYESKVRVLHTEAVRKNLERIVTVLIHADAQVVSSAQRSQGS